MTKYHGSYLKGSHLWIVMEYVYLPLYKALRLTVVQVLFWWLMLRLGK